MFIKSGCKVNGTCRYNHEKWVADKDTCKYHICRVNKKKGPHIADVLGIILMITVYCTCKSSKSLLFWSLRTKNCISVYGFMIHKSKGCPLLRLKNRFFYCFRVRHNIDNFSPWTPKFFVLNKEYNHMVS